MALLVSVTTLSSQEVHIPLNEGCLAPLELVIPDGSMLAPQAPAAARLRLRGAIDDEQPAVPLLRDLLR